MDIKKIRRRIEDFLRKAPDKTILMVAELLGIKVSE